MIEVFYAYSTSTFDVVMYQGHLYRVPFDRFQYTNKPINAGIISAEYITDSNQIA